MLSDEEKEAIETVKFFKKMKWYSHAFDNGTEILCEDEKQDIDIVLNLIEKQSKEIEELKNADLTTVYLNGFYDGEKKVKDKIKAKIEEVKDGTFDAKIVLQSLLEKE